MCVYVCVCVSGNTESSGAEEVLGLYFIAIKMNLNYLKQRNINETRVFLSLLHASSIRVNLSLWIGGKVNSILWKYSVKFFAFLLQQIFIKWLLRSNTTTIVGTEDGATTHMHTQTSLPPEAYTRGREMNNQQNKTKFVFVLA